MLLATAQKDISKVEQFRNCYLYVVFNADVNIVAVRETFLGFISEKNQSAETVGYVIRDNIKEAELDISKCRGQDYDGAFVMSDIH